MRTPTVHVTEHTSMTAAQVLEAARDFSGVAPSCGPTATSSTSRSTSSATRSPSSPKTTRAVRLHLGAPALRLVGTRLRQDCCDRLEHLPPRQHVGDAPDARRRRHPGQGHRGPKTSRGPRAPSSGRSSASGSTAESPQTICAISCRTRATRPANDTLPQHEADLQVAAPRYERDPDAASYAVITASGGRDLRVQNPEVDGARMAEDRLGTADLEARAPSEASHSHSAVTKDVTGRDRADPDGHHLWSPTALRRPKPPNRWGSE